MDKEPWFLPANQAGYLAEGEDWIANNQKFRQGHKYEFFRLALDFLKENGVAGSYFEFGCHRARTFTMAMSLDAFYASQGTGTAGKPVFDRYYAFDSFRGLPESAEADGMANWKTGALATSKAEFTGLLQNYGLATDRVECIEGFYKDSLTPELGQKLAAANVEASMITLDCDLESAYVSVFDFIDPFLTDGTVVYIDDFFAYQGNPKRGAQKVFRDFRTKSRFQFNEFLTVGWGGKSFIAYR